MNPKLILIIRIVAQLLAQGAVLALFPASSQVYLQAIVAALGVLLAHFDTSVAAAMLGMTKAEFMAHVASKNPLNK